MWLSLNILKKFTSISEKLSLEEWSSLISLKIAEVEDIKYVGESLKKVKVVRVLSTKPHPNAEKLQLARIFDGKVEKEIICGASNCRTGIKVPLADLGTVLDIQGEKFKIELRNIRGIESSGMLCSESELGLAENSAGLLELSKNSLEGCYLTDLPEYVNAVDILFEIDNKSLTHRPDLWGHYGFAREFATIFKNTLHPYCKYELPNEFSNDFKVDVQELDVCYRYSTLLIKGVQVRNSPKWLKQGLERLGINRVNNIVDLTNYVMAELGQPMHAFDLAKLDNSKNIHIRYAKEDEKLLGLNNELYSLVVKDLVISDDTEVLALAGIIGGKPSSVSDETVDIVLEAASFDAYTVRQSSQRLGIKTDSSQRFEKSLSPKKPLSAINRFVELLKTSLNQDVKCSSLVDVNNNPYGIKKINTSYEFINNSLGVNLSKSFVDMKLIGLGFELSGDLNITVPAWRATKDISIAEDIVEEVARHYGYDLIDYEMPKLDLTIPVENKERILERKFKEFIVEGLGFSEIFSYPWVGKDLLEDYGLSTQGYMTITNPVSNTSQFMRQDAIPQLIEAVELNLKYFGEFKIFEFGRNFFKHEESSLSKESKSVVACIVPALNKKDELQESSFYEAKQIVSDLLKLAGIKSFQYGAIESPRPYIHPNINLSFKQGTKVLAQVFKLNPNISQKKSIKNNVYCFVIDFTILAGRNRKFSYELIDRHPTVNFDITVSVDQEIWAIELENIIRKNWKKEVKDVSVFSVYQDEVLKEKGKKNISFRIFFDNKGKTMSPKEISSLQEEIMKKFDIHN